MTVSNGGFFKACSYGLLLNILVTRREELLSSLVSILIASILLPFYMGAGKFILFVCLMLAFVSVVFFMVDLFLLNRKEIQPDTGAAILYILFLIAFHVLVIYWIENISFYFYLVGAGLFFGFVSFRFIRR